MARRQVVIPAPSPPRDSEAALGGFLARTLPKAKARQAGEIAAALAKAAARYNRYMARMDEWRDYAPRRKRLEKVVTFADQLQTSLGEIDIMTREDFAIRVEQTQIETLMGSLRFLKNDFTKLVRGIQTAGRPRELAEERMILDVADIYENAFGQKPTIGPAKRRGSFYELLTLCWPDRQRLRGSLSVRQVKRTLARRNTSTQKSSFI